MDYDIKLNDQFIAVICDALNRLPHGVVRPVFDSLESQVQKQQQALHDKAADQADKPSGENP